MKELHYYSASWCNPCRTLGPIMNQVGQNINVIKHDVDASPEAASSAGIRSVPTVILIENGQEKKRFSGIKSYDQIINWINEK